MQGRESAGKEEEKDSEETVGSLDCAGSKWVGMVGGGEAEEPDGSGFEEVGLENRESVSEMVFT